MTFTSASQAQREYTREKNHGERLDQSPYHICNRSANEARSLFDLFCLIEQRAATLPQWMAVILADRRNVARMRAEFTKHGAISAAFINATLQQQDAANFEKWSKTGHFQAS